MEILTISGGSGLFGEVRIPGAKNSVLPIMAASVLCRGTVTLTDVPHLSDVEASARILQSVSCWRMGAPSLRRRNFRAAQCRSR